ncbi:MAG: TIM barrel protein [Clostridia bacterium]|nr:TIM barrel protein [Clostridia bacterium]
MNTLGVSGSTIMSDPQKFHQLFEHKLNHIEIGEFASRRDVRAFINMLKISGATLGIHAPILRGRSKYDVIEQVDFPPSTAIRHLERDAKMAKRMGAKYLLVHFPFFSKETAGDTNSIIENGLAALYKIQQKYHIPIVCEPKLGLLRSAAGIEYLNNFMVDIWAKYQLKICIDLGDYVMAVGDKKALKYIKKWSDFIMVVHLHNVDYPEGHYYWKPMHKNDETDGHHNLLPIMEYLAGLKDIYFVLEHTPHMGYPQSYVLEGIEYVKGMVFKE